MKKDKMNYTKLISSIVFFIFFFSLIIFVGTKIFENQERKRQEEILNPTPAMVLYKYKNICIDGVTYIHSFTESNKAAISVKLGKDSKIIECE